MKRLVVGALVLMVVGCGSPQTAPVVQVPKDAWVSESALVAEAVAVAQMRRDVIAGHTLYSHDFIPGSAALYDWGRRDLAILADHYRVFPGPVNVERGDAADNLYNQRIDTVLRGLARAGVEARRMEVADATPPASGGPADRLVLVQLRYQRLPNTAPAPAGLASAGTDLEP